MENGIDTACVIRVLKAALAQHPIESAVCSTWLGDPQRGAAAKAALW
jgi:hypothetical protein